MNFAKACDKAGLPAGRPSSFLLRDASGAEEAVIGHVGEVDIDIITLPLPIVKFTKHCMMRLETSKLYCFPEYRHESFTAKLTNDRSTARVTCLSSVDNEIADLEVLPSAVSAYFGDS